MDGWLTIDSLLSTNLHICLESRKEDSMEFDFSCKFKFNTSETKLKSYIGETLTGIYLNFIFIHETLNLMMIT